ncbi:hypothetical protein [Candidatus Liberibacter solanacearum]|uniref:hypothetical protein n=1 Tax=Candidatus Liberibacter solanacearum TaxID=556287 RepID=UPI000F512E82|nr:hypothetical protein [Candidatus Liberibacter solanacearum]
MADKLHDYFPSKYITPNHFWHAINLSGHVDYALQQDVLQGLQELGKAALKAKEVFPELKKLGFEDKDFENFRKVSSDLEMFVEDEFIELHLLDTFNSVDNDASCA